MILTAILHITGGFIPEFLASALAWAALINIVLMVFNLIPIPPLDGSRIVARFLKGRILWQYMRLERFGLFIVFGLLFLGVISSILQPVMYWAVKILNIYQFL